MNTPASLKKGDKVAILNPASYIHPDVDLTPAYEILQSWGLEPVIYDSISAQYHQFAGDDELRTSDFQKALDDPEIKAIIAGRGGYGCVRIVDKIEFKNFTLNPKWIVGFSDITALHSHIQKNLKIPTIHGQMVKAFLTASPESLDTLKNALFGKKVDLKFGSNNTLNRKGKAKGKLIGGNLAILQSILASDSDVKYDDKILFIEDVGESYYNLDRMLWSLKRAKKFDKIKGLIVGGFTSLKDSNPSFGSNFQEIIYEKVKEYNFPIAFDCPAGHIDDNRALILGKKIVLNVSEKHSTIKYI